MAQHGGPPGWLEESDPAGCDFVRDGRSMPPALTDHTTCPGLGLILTIYAPTIYTAPCVRFLMRADRLGGEVGALEIESFVGLYEIARADRRVLFGAQGRINHWCIGGFMNTRIT